VFTTENAEVTEETKPRWDCGALVFSFLAFGSASLCLAGRPRRPSLHVLSNFKVKTWAGRSARPTRAKATEPLPALGLICRI
jgi:hypothetical protein